MLNRGVEGKTNLDEVTKEVPERPADRRGDFPRIQLISESEGEVSDRARAKTVKKVKA
jgi:hypothetical protein